MTHATGNVMYACKIISEDVLKIKYILIAYLLNVEEPTLRSYIIFFDFVRPIDYCSTTCSRNTVVVRFPYTSDD